MKKILILLGLLIWVGTIYGQSGVIRRTQTALVDTLPTHIVKANWDIYVASGGGGGGTALTVQTVTSATSISFDYDSGEAGDIASYAHDATITFNNVPDGGWGWISLQQDGSTNILTAINGSTGYTTVVYDGGFELINSTASERGMIEYKRSKDVLWVSVHWYE